MTSVANVNFQQNVPNLKVINFKAGENDRTQYRPQSQAPVITRPPMNDQIMLQRMLQEQQKQEKKQKTKQNLSWGIGIASGLAIIAMVIAQFKGLKGMDKVSEKAQEIITRNVDNEKTLEQLNLTGELKKATDNIKIRLDRAENLSKKGGHGNAPIMLYGEPGGGKNAWVYALTKYIQSKFPGSELIMMDVLKFNGMYHGQTENNIIGFTNNIIKKAMTEPEKKFVVFLDEFDSIARKDIGSNAASSEKFQNAFKTSFNILLEVPNIQIIAATNKAAKEASLTTLLDEAIVNRFADKVFIPLPNKTQLEKAFVEHYSKLAPEVIKPELVDMKNATLNKLCDYISLPEHHASFRDMNYILDRARLLSESGKTSEPISIENLTQAVKDHAESMNWNDIKKLQV